MIKAKKLLAITLSVMLLVTCAFVQIPQVTASAEETRVETAKTNLVTAWKGMMDKSKHTLVRNISSSNINVLKTGSTKAQSYKDDGGGYTSYKLDTTSGYTITDELTNEKVTVYNSETANTTGKFAAYYNCDAENMVMDLTDKNPNDYVFYIKVNNLSAETTNLSFTFCSDKDKDGNGKYFSVDEGVTTKEFFFQSWNSKIIGVKAVKNNEWVRVSIKDLRKIFEETHSDLNYWDPTVVRRLFIGCGSEVSNWTLENVEVSGIYKQEPAFENSYFEGKDLLTLVKDGDALDLDAYDATEDFSAALNDAKVALMSDPETMPSYADMLFTNATEKAVYKPTALFDTIWDRTEENNTKWEIVGTPSRDETTPDGEEIKYYTFTEGTSTSGIIISTNEGYDRGHNLKIKKSDYAAIYVWYKAEDTSTHNNKNWLMYNNDNTGKHTNVTMTAPSNEWKKMDVLAAMNTADDYYDGQPNGTGGRQSFIARLGATRFEANDYPNGISLSPMYGVRKFKYDGTITDIYTAYDFITSIETEGLTAEFKAEVDALKSNVEGFVDINDKDFYKNYYAAFQQLDGNIAVSSPDWDDCRYIAEILNANTASTGILARTVRDTANVRKTAIEKEMKENINGYLSQVREFLLNGTGVTNKDVNFDGVIDICDLVRIKKSGNS